MCKVGNTTRNTADHDYMSIESYHVSPLSVKAHDKGHQEMPTVLLQLTALPHLKRQGSRCGLPEQTKQIGTRKASRSIGSLPCVCGPARMKHFPCTAKARCRDEGRIAPEKTLRVLSDAKREDGK